jgi:hypothetical protein
LPKEMELSTWEKRLDNKLIEAFLLQDEAFAN